MSAIVFNGREFAKEREGELLVKVSKVSEVSKVSKVPKLVAILIGNNPESRLYLKLKEKKAIQLGIDFEFREFSKESPQEIIDYIQEKNTDPKVNGIIIELPLPKELDKYDILDKISPEKDVDCLTSENLRLLDEGKPRFIPPTVKAVGEIIKLQITNYKLQIGKIKIVVVGSEGVVGKGILSYLRNVWNQGEVGKEGGDGKEGEIVGIDKETKDISLITKTADILISCTGIGLLIKKEMVKSGAIVIDVGIEKQPDGSLVGDVDFEQVKEAASFITPVPGGVGPVTIVSLMENLLTSC